MLPGTGRSPVGHLARFACQADSCAASRNGRQACERAGRLFRRRFGCFRCGPVQGTVPLNSYRYRPCVSTLQVRVLTRYLHVIFASRCGNLRGRGKPQTARRAPRTHNKRSARPANRPQTARRAPRTRSERGAGPTSRPQASRGREPNGPLPNFTRRSCFFKASFRRRSYYMNRSLSLSFTDRALPSAIRPSEVSHSRLARGARGSRPRPADSQDAVFPSAPLCRLPSRDGKAHRGVSLPASQRTAAASHRGGPAFRRGNCQAQISSPQSNPPLAAAGLPSCRTCRSTKPVRQPFCCDHRLATGPHLRRPPGSAAARCGSAPHSAASALHEVVALALPCR